MKTIYYLLDALHGLAALARLFVPTHPHHAIQALGDHTGGQEWAYHDIHSPAAHAPHQRNLFNALKKGLVLGPVASPPAPKSEILTFPPNH